MPHRTFSYNAGTTYTCDAHRCLFTDLDQRIVTQHEHDAHGPGLLDEPLETPRPTVRGVIDA